jgi:integrase
MAPAAGPDSIVCTGLTAAAAYDEAARDLRMHYETTGSRDPDEAAKRFKHLDGFFLGRRLASIGGADAGAYVAHRQKDEAANGTINRELAVLTKMLRLAYENGKLLRLRVIRKLKEASPRSGFLEVAQFEAVCRHLPEDLRVAVAVGYVFGWRVQEVLGIERRHVDLDRGTLALDPGSTKNDEGRIVYMPPDVKVAVAAQLARVDGLQRKLQRIVPWVFPNLRGAASRTLAGGASRCSVSAAVTSGKRGPLPAERPGCRECFVTTCGGARSATWSTPACRRGSP